MPEFIIVDEQVNKNDHRYLVVMVQANNSTVANLVMATCGDSWYATIIQAALILHYEVQDGTKSVISGDNKLEIPL